MQQFQSLNEKSQKLHVLKKEDQDVYFNSLYGTVEPLCNGHLGDRRKWPLWRGWNKSECMDCLPKNGRCKEVAILLRWPLVEVWLYKILWCTGLQKTYFQLFRVSCKWDRFSCRATRYKSEHKNNVLRATCMTCEIQQHLKDLLFYVLCHSRVVPCFLQPVGQVIISWFHFSHHTDQFKLHYKLMKLRMFHVEQGG